MVKSCHTQIHQTRLVFFSLLTLWIYHDAALVTFCWQKESKVQYQRHQPRLWLNIWQQVARIAISSISAPGKTGVVQTGSTSQHFKQTSKNEAPVPVTMGRRLTSHLALIGTFALTVSHLGSAPCHHDSKALINDPSGSAGLCVVWSWML